MKPIVAVLLLAAFTLLFSSCSDDEGEGFISPDEDIATFARVADITIGDEGAAEIAAFDPLTDQLFVVNNADDSKIDVIDFSTPADMRIITEISVNSYGGGVNSVAVSRSYLAAAIEADSKTDNGVVVVFNTTDFSEVARLTVGALPDMVTFTPDGQYILVANEGEPSDDYTNDPNGSVSIISTDDFVTTTVDFTDFNSSESVLEGEGFRVTGPSADLAADAEPEFIAVSADSRTAFVALQENNGLAIIDIRNKTVTGLKGLGFKDYAAKGIVIDPSDEDDKTELRTVPSGIFGVYMPDAIDVFSVDGTEYVITANEGDGREYFYDTDAAPCLLNGGEFDEDDGCLAFTDEARLEDVTLDPTSFPDAATLQNEENFGRLKVITTAGDTDGDGDYDRLYTYGARSFSIWDTQGNLLFDSGSEVEEEVINAGLYEDGRSDDKGIEPEGVVTGKVNGKTLAFIGLERVDAVAIYDVSNPENPQFISILETGDAPEGLVFVDAEDSPNGRSLLIVTCEGDGSVWVYSPALNS
ncbi:MAG: choice-of-anchor I family protein [Cyclobacteriaceae bacterium]